MAEVNVKVKLKRAGKWGFYQVLRENGKPRLDRIVVNGKAVPSKGGTFYLDWREGGKRRHAAVGNNAREALDALRTMVAHLNSKDPSSVPVPFLTQKRQEGVLLENAYTTFLSKTKATRTEGTYRDYRQAVDWLAESVSKKYVEEISKEDLVGLFALGRTQGYAQTTINKRVIVFLRAMKDSGSAVSMGKGEWPKVVSRMVYTYSLDELTAFFKACHEPRDLAMYQSYLLTGFRRREVTTLTQPDIGDRVVQVRAKPDLKFQPKNWEERTVPVPRKLTELLRSLPKTHRLVFPSRPHPQRGDLSGGNEDSLALIRCKEIALEAGLNCGMCRDKHDRSCADNAVCEGWFLHKFRHTFATQMLLSGTDIRRLQILLGHKQLATTEKYLRSIGIEGMEEHIEGSSLAQLL